MFGYGLQHPLQTRHTTRLCSRHTFLHRTHCKLSWGHRWVFVTETAGYFHHSELVKRSIWAKPWKPLILSTTPAFKQQLCKKAFSYLKSAIKRKVKRKDLLCFLWLCFWRTVVACRHGGRKSFLFQMWTELVWWTAGIGKTYYLLQVFGPYSWNTVLVPARDVFSRR